MARPTRGCVGRPIAVPASNDPRSLPGSGLSRLCDNHPRLEPYAYESTLLVRLVIEALLARDRNLSHDPRCGDVGLPLCLWDLIFGTTG